MFAFSKRLKSGGSQKGVSSQMNLIPKNPLQFRILILQKVTFNRLYADISAQSTIEV